MENELNQRLFSFIIRLIKFIKSLDDSIDNKIIKYQIIKSATSTTSALFSVEDGLLTQDDLDRKPEFPGPIFQIKSAFR